MWLSRQANGLYMLTAAKPVCREVKGTGQMDLYVRYGDPIGVRNLCGIIAKQAGVTIQPLGSVRIEVSARVVD